ncbi:IclR family transcriptional regulator [Rhodococcus sp. (in: high G+C Gram-positive bacteria)]|uniref:IclR family transcriptional regulator n=1 Tax=Rhodococcus sp. TaxID=1831 RepID=UPI001A1A0AD1|nr:IclR family transcriptional regulator [Rhodococcus sp. (in: high G+C Gram-positive bacteria)]MBJ7476313.1 IclR family transcriptional regulator [Rhodococcus sp. (in: high G+C Gram-positive bacteria)]
MAPGDVTRSANRTFELLGAIVEHGGLTLGDAAKATDLATSTALRLIRSLEQTEFVVRGEDNVYRVGPRLLQIGARALGDNQLLPRARPAMKAIAETTRESTYLSTMGPKDTALYLDQIEGTHAIRHMGWVGQSVPLNGTAVGAALSGKVGESGYAIAHDTIEDHSTGVAAPIYNAVGQIAGALSVVGPTFRLTDEACASHGRVLVEHCARLSAELGSQTP